MKTLVALLCLSTAVAFGGTRDPSTPDSKHVEYGENFKCVVKVRTRRTSDGKDQFASGVVVSPRHVVTAAHVVNGTSEWSVEDGDKRLPITGFAIHPQWDDDRFGHNDLAVATLKDVYSLDYYPTIYKGDTETGEIVSLCGYGVTGTFVTGYAVSDGLKRAGSNIVDRVEGGLLVCSVSSGRRTSLEYLITPGDSGGGLFIGNELAGIHSIIMRNAGSPSGRYGDESGHTRLTLHRDWILEQIDCDK